MAVSTVVCLLKARKVFFFLRTFYGVLLIEFLFFLGGGGQVCDDKNLAAWFGTNAFQLSVAASYWGSSSVCSKMCCSSRDSL